MRSEPRSLNSSNLSWSSRPILSTKSLIVQVGRCVLDVIKIFFLILFVKTFTCGKTLTFYEQALWQRPATASLRHGSRTPQEVWEHRTGSLGLKLYVADVILRSSVCSLFASSLFIECNESNLKFPFSSDSRASFLRRFFVFLCTPSRSSASRGTAWSS
jgi:hypothetical protein